MFVHLFVCLLVLCLFVFYFVLFVRFVRSFVCLFVTSGRFERPPVLNIACSSILAHSFLLCFVFHSLVFLFVFFDVFDVLSLLFCSLFLFPYLFVFRFGFSSLVLHSVRMFGRVLFCFPSLVSLIGRLFVRLLRVGLCFTLFRSFVSFIRSLVRSFVCVFVCSFDCFII